MAVVLVRTLILYALVVTTLRLMGKRQIGELQPYELVVTIMIAEVAAIPMEDVDIPLINGIIPIITLLLAEITLSFLAMKNESARRLFNGTPTILIENGKIREDRLRRLRFSINDLLEELRVKNVANIADVEYAIMETNGTLSVILKSQKRPVQPADLGLKTEYEGLPLPLIVDGVLNEGNLRKASLDLQWLDSKIRAFGLKGPEEVFFASLDTSGNLYLQPKAKGGGKS